MTPKNDTKKGAKKTPKKKARPTYQIRDELAYNKFSGYMIQYPILKKIEPRRSYLRDRRLIHGWRIKDNHHHTPLPILKREKSQSWVSSGVKRERKMSPKEQKILHLPVKQEVKILSRVLRMLRVVRNYNIAIVHQLIFFLRHRSSRHYSLSQPLFLFVMTLQVIFCTIHLFSSLEFFHGFHKSFMTY